LGKALCEIAGEKEFMGLNMGCVSELEESGVSLRYHTRMSIRGVSGEGQGVGVGGEECWGNGNLLAIIPCMDWRGVEACRLAIFVMAPMYV
jgi:hypothetical protein